MTSEQASLGVLLLSHSPDNPNGGASRVFHLLRQGLESEGHSVTLRHLDDMHVPRNRIGALIATRMFMPRIMSDSGLAENAAEYDVIVSPSGIGHRLYSTLEGAPKAPLRVNLVHGLAKYDHAASMSESHLGHWPVSLPYRLVTGPSQVRWDAAGMRSADHTVVQNLRDLAEVRDMLGDGAQVTLIPPAIHPELLEASRDVGDIAERPAGALLWFGTWEARKGAHYLPEAFRALRKEFPEATLTLGGTGRQGADLLPLFDEADRASVRVLGRITNAEQAEVFTGASIFLFPSLSEGFGLALVEAMCFGLAAVTTSTAFGGDYLTDGVDGRVVSPSGAHLARAVADLVRDPAARSSMAERGRTLARTFTVERSASAYSRLFEQSLAVRRRESPQGQGSL